MQENILYQIRMNPYVSQQELADNIGLSRSSVAGYIADLIKQGKITGRAYILKEDTSIACIGGANIDRKAHGKQKLDLYSSNPVSISESSGGVARNVSENLSKLGANSALFTCVGTDKEGNWLLEEAKNFGMDVSQVWRMPDVRTGTYTAILDIDGEMIISTADMELYNQLTPAMIEGKWHHIANSRAVFIDTNLPAESIHYIIERCQHEKLSLYVDPVSILKAKKLPDNLQGIELIFPNKEEAEWLANMEINDLADCETASQRIRERGVSKVVITLGEEGAYYAEDGSAGYVTPVKTEVADVTGAGDAFSACVTYALLEGHSLSEASEMGQIASTLTLESDYTVSPLLNIEKIIEMTKERLS